MSKIDTIKINSLAVEVLVMIEELPDSEAKVQLKERYQPIFDSLAEITASHTVLERFLNKKSGDVKVEANIPKEGSDVVG